MIPNSQHQDFQMWNKSMTMLKVIRSEVMSSMSIIVKHPCSSYWFFQKLKNPATSFLYSRTATPMPRPGYILIPPDLAPNRLNAQGCRPGRNVRRGLPQCKGISDVSLWIMDVYKKIMTGIFLIARENVEQPVMPVSEMREKRRGESWQEQCS